MTIVVFLLVVAAAGLGGYAVLVRLGLDDLEAWAGGRVAGLVLAAVPAWWAGVVGIHGWRVVGWTVLIVLALAGAWEAWRRRRWRSLLAAEAIFLVAAAAVVFLRLDHPQIVYTEKPMDLGILATLLRAQGFPPPDMWLSGFTLPYYYWGALLWTVPISLAGIPLELAYNLIVGLIGGMMAALLWMLGRRAARSHWGGLLAAFFGVLAGTPDGVRQLLAGARLGGLDYWHSSRQVTDAITEWPLFTLWLGDLHPHLLSIPIVCLALLIAWQAGRKGPSIDHAVALAVLFGVAWAANPWSMPPTLVGIALLLTAGEDRWHWPTGDGWRRWAVIPAIAAGGWLATAPFHLNFQPFFQGVRLVHGWTAPGELLLYAGCLVVPAALAAWALLRRLSGDAGQAGLAIALLVLAAVVVLAGASRRPTLVLLTAVLTVLVCAVLTPVAGRDRPALAIAALGIFLLLVPEIVYVADNYGDKLHRMNTVFKAYIQGWIFLVVALPVLLRLAVRRVPVRAALIGVMVVLSLAHPAAMAVQQVTADELGINGMRWMPEGDRMLVRALREQPPGTTLVEAVGGAYTDYSRLSAASGVPAFLGWENHELVWRGSEITEETGRRRKVVEELYSSGDPDEVRRIAAEEGIDLVAIGSLERRDFDEQGLAAVAAAGEVIAEGHDAQLIRVGGL